MVRFGTPIQIHTDQGRNFYGNVLKTLCKLLVIAKTHNTPYRPSSNGQLERYNRTLTQFIRCFLEGKQQDWDKYVPALGMSIHATINRDTGFTPNMMVLGREVNMPSDVLFGIANANRKELEPPEHVTELLRVLRESLEKDQQNL